jgi:hypothetical protein
MQFNYDNYLELLNSILAEHTNEQGITSEQLNNFRDEVIANFKTEHPNSKIDFLPYYNQTKKVFELKIYIHISRDESYGFDITIPKALDNEQSI